MEKTKENKDIRFLVFSGGGAAGYAFGGAIEQLAQQPNFDFNKIQGVAGTSVGAIAALLVSLNYTPAEITQKFNKLDFKKMADSGNMFSSIYRLFTKYGRYKGEALDNLIREIIQEKTKCPAPESITFADLKALGCKDLYIVATKIYRENNSSTGKQKIFSFETTPHTPILGAMRATTAATTYFERVRLKKVAPGNYQIDPTGHLYEDGGLINNFAIDIFDHPKFMGMMDDGQVQIVNPNTLGLALLNTNDIRDETHKPHKDVLKDNHPKEFASGVTHTLMHQFYKQKLDKAENRARTIQIDRLNVALNQFDMSNTKKKELYQSGRDCVKNYFSSKQPANDNVISTTPLFWQTPPTSSSYDDDLNVIKINKKSGG